VFPKIGVPQKDGENNGKPYFLMDDLGVPLLAETSMESLLVSWQKKMAPASLHGSSHQRLPVTASPVPLGRRDLFERSSLGI